MPGHRLGVCSFHFSFSCSELREATTAGGRHCHPSKASVPLGLFLSGENTAHKPLGLANFMFFLSIIQSVVSRCLCVSAACRVTKHGKQIRGFQYRNRFLTVLETRGPRSRCHRLPFSVKFPVGSSFSLCPPKAEREAARVSLPARTLTPLGLGPTLMASFHLNHLLKAPVSKHSLRRLKML